MNKLYTAIFATLVVLQQAINPVQLAVAPTAYAQAEAVSTDKTNYQLNLNTTNTKAVELKDNRATFDTAVLAPLRAAQDAQAKAKADAEAAQKAAQAAAQVSAKPAAVTAPAVSMPSGDVKQLAYAMVCAKWGCDQWTYVDYIVNRESGWNPNALNRSSGACGLFQALPCSKMGGTDINNQLNWGMGYIANRYGTPANAYSFWLAHHWY